MLAKARKEQSPVSFQIFPARRKRLSPSPLAPPEFVEGSEDGAADVDEAELGQAGGPVAAEEASDAFDHAQGGEQAVLYGHLRAGAVGADHEGGDIVCAQAAVGLLVDAIENA